MTAKTRHDRREHSHWWQTTSGTLACAVRSDVYRGDAEESVGPLRASVSLWFLKA